MMNLYDAGYGGDLPDSMYGSDLYLSEEERKKKQATQPLPPGVAPYQGQQAVNKTPEPQKQEPQAATGVVQPAEPAPTFAELQAQGKARPAPPPAPAAVSSYAATRPEFTAQAPSAAQIGASYIDPTTGQPVTTATPPVGIPYYASAPLVNDGRQTAVATPWNAFEGYVSPQGGTFGGGPSADTMGAIRKLESVTGLDASKFGDLSNMSAADIDAISRQMGLIANGDRAATAAALNSPIPAIRDAARSYTMGLGSQGATADQWNQYQAAQAVRQFGLPERLQPIVDVLRQPTTSTVSTGGATGTASTGGATGTTSTGGATGTAGTGEFTGDIGGYLGQKLAGQGVGPAGLDLTQVGQYIQQMLQNPSAYNSAEVKKTYDTLAQNIDDQFAQQQTAVREEMARRGLSDSSILGGRLADLNVQRRSAKEQLANQLATQQAQDFAQARAAAINAALGGQQQYYGQNMGYLDRLMNYGQQGFQNAMTQAEFNRLLQNDQDQMMLKMLGLA